MKADDFISSRFGRVTKNPVLAWAHNYYLPEPIPRELELTAETVASISRADIALGKLAGLGLLINEPELLLGPSMAQEALSSSRIEGTQAWLSDVLSAENETVDIQDENLREVDNYLKAANQGVELLTSLPITQRFICALHGTLLDNVRVTKSHLESFAVHPSGSAHRTLVRKLHDSFLVTRTIWEICSAIGNASSTSLVLCHPFSSTRLCTTSSRPSTRFWTVTAASAVC